MSYESATSVASVLGKAAQNAGALEHSNQQMGDDASVFDVWTHSYDGMSERMRAFAEDPVGTLQHYDRDLNAAVEAGLSGDWRSSSLAAVGDSIAAQAEGLGAMVNAIGEGEGALATVGATFALLTGVEQMLSTLVSVIPFPSLPAIRVTDMDVGLPHAHSHPPNLVPPAPPVPLPSTGPIIPIPILSGAARTLINGMPAARCGDMGLGIWCGGYFPMYEVFLGSSSVWIEGARAGRLAVDITKHCVFTSPKPSDPPMGPMVGVTISASANVLIGGVPMPSLLSLAMGAAIKGMMRGMGKAARGFDRATRGLRQRMFRNMKPGFLKCRVLRAEPVDVVTGEVTVDQQDFSIPGRIPIEWNRHYGSRSERMGVCGYGWETLADARLVFEEDRTVTFYDGSAAPTLFPAVPLRRPVMELVDGAILERLGDSHVVRTKQGLDYYFPISATAAREALISHVQDRCDNSLSFIRDENGLRRIVESAGRIIEVQSDAGRIQQMALSLPDAPAMPLVGFQYDAEGNLIAVYDALGVPYRFAYRDHRLVGHTDRNGLCFHYEYDGRGAKSRCVHTWGDGGLYDYRLSYVDQQRQTAIVDSLGHTWKVTYDYRFQIIEEVDPLGGLTTYEYDTAGRTSAVVDPAGNRTEYVYDERGSLCSLTRADGHAIVTEYNADGNVVDITDFNGQKWHQTWDERGRLTSQTSPVGTESRYRYIYDVHGQLASFISPEGGQSLLYYDRLGNLATFVDALKFTTRFSYDVRGNVMEKIDPQGGRTRYRYDAKGRLVMAVLPSGASISCSYDGEDNLVGYQDQEGGITRLEYFGQGEIKRRQLANGHTVEFEYDTEERLVGLRNQRGEWYRLDRDPLGRIVSETDYWGQTRHYTYGPGGFLREAIDPLGRVTKYEADPIGQITRKIRFGLPHTEAEIEPAVETFGYDPNGNLLICENSAIRVERAFDEEGRLLREAQGPDCVVRNQYDAAGNRIIRTVELNAERGAYKSTVRYGYDHLGQAVSVQIGVGRAVAISRDGLGRITSERMGSRLKRTRAYDADSLLLREEIATPEGRLFGVDYEYDRLWNLTARREPERADERFAYDAVGQLTAHIDSQGRRHEYPTDPAGDRLRPQPANLDEASLDQPWTRRGGFGGRRYEFDSAGDLIRCGYGSSGSSDIHLHWQNDHRLGKSVSDGRETAYRYDPLGRRIAKLTASGNVRFYWDGDAMLLEHTDNASALPTTDIREWTYYPGTFVPLAMEQTSTTFQRALAFYHNSSNGCPKRLLGEDGAVLWAAEHSAWGEVLENRNQWRNPLRLQGQYADDETGFHFSRQRYYDPLLGAFISQDPLRLAAGVNLYAYAPNPHAWIDPFGLSCYFDARAGRWRNRQTGRFEGLPNDPSELVHNGSIDFRDVQAWANAHGLPNSWTPSANFPAGGFRYHPPGGGSIHGHGVNPTAVANYPGSNAATGPTASIRDGAGQNFKTNGTWGSFGSDPNGAHIPLDNSPY